MLSNFQVGEKALLQSFLLGQEEFRMTLSTPGMEQFRQRIIASCHLGPLSKEETRDYILHRLKLSGWQDNPRFSDGAFEQIFEHTEGIPRTINLLCDRLLLWGCIEELHEIDHLAVRTVIDEMKQEQYIADVEDVAPDMTPDNTEAGSARSSGVAKQAEAVKPAEVVNNVQPLHPANTISNAERRLTLLEKQIELLQESSRSDYKRLQRMIMILALSDDNDEGMVETLKKLGSVDE